MSRDVVARTTAVSYATRPSRKHRSQSIGCLKFGGSLYRRQAQKMQCFASIARFWLMPRHPDAGLGWWRRIRYFQGSGELLVCRLVPPWWKTHRGTGWDGCFAYAAIERRDEVHNHKNCLGRIQRPHRVGRRVSLACVSPISAICPVTLPSCFRFVSPYTAERQLKTGGSMGVEPRRALSFAIV